MIHKFSFDFRDRYFGFDGLQFAFRVCTFENVYGTDPGQVVVTPRGAGIRCEAQSLQFAGGQRQCPGRIVADIWRDDNELKFKATVQHQEGVKGITTLIRGLAAPVGEERIPIFSNFFPVENPGKPFSTIKVDIVPRPNF